MPDIVFDFRALSKAANLDALAGRPQNDVHATHKAPEPVQDYSGLYWPGHGQRWVQDASGKWVTESDDNFVRDAQGNVVMDFGFPMRKNKQA